MTTKPREIDSPAEAAKVTPLLARQALPEPPRDAEPGRNPGMPLALDWLDECGWSTAARSSGALRRSPSGAASRPTTRPPGCSRRSR